MKIQCDVCEKSIASIICCADEAALCADCDLEVHEANKLASKHQRLHLDYNSMKFPRCDICQEKAAFIFCVEDRALFCRDCDDSIHPQGSIRGNHQRLLATGIRVAQDAPCMNDSDQVSLEPPRSQDPVYRPAKRPHSSSCASANTGYAMQQKQYSPSSETWIVNELLQFSEFDFENKQKENTGFGELEWIDEIGLFDDHVGHEMVPAALVPELPSPTFHHTVSRPPKSSTLPFKKPRFEIDPDDFFTVPDLGDMV